ncbi:MAG TPA: hypothetical protein VFX50_04040, partial [Gemmatimonadales bacterium]|nr:hypothetical protein [Gemmatimonadales bacterium]
DEGEVAAALASLLRAVGEEQPLLLAIDDAASADGATLRALHAALRGLGDVPLLVFLTLVPPAPDTPPALLALLGDLGRGLEGALLTLESFTDAEIAELVAASARWCATPEDRARLARRLAFETGGDPLLCTTLLDSLQELTAAREDLLQWPPPQLTLESPLPVPVPVVVHSLLLARLAGLDAGDRRVLGAAALTGERIDEALVAAMLDVGAEVVAPALARLERARLVEATEDGYRFGAPLLARLLLHTCLASAERRQCARRGAELLAVSADPARQLLRCELELEQGSAHAPEAARTVLALSRSAGVALPRAARRVVERAADALRALPGKEPARQPLLVELDELRERLRAAAADERGR